MGWLWLLLWQILYPSIGCLLSILFIAPVLGLIAKSMLESASMRRQATVAMYLNPQRWLYRFFRRSIFMVLWQIFKATFFAIFIITEAIFFDSWVWILLFFDVIFIFIFYHFFTKILNDQVKIEYAQIFAREYLMIFNSMVFSLIISIIGFYMPYPDYRELTWLQAIEYEVIKIQGDCQITLIMARFSAAKNAISWWLAETWLTKISDSYLAFLVWLIFLLNSTAFVWAYSRMLLGILTFFGNQPNRTESVLKP